MSTTERGPFAQAQRLRAIIHRSRGSNHGAITRLMSPGDLGQVLKPFVFLDAFDNGGKPFPTFGMHPHSGLATLTYVLEGSVSYRDTNAASGFLREGGIEWMRAGRGAWHSGGAGDPGVTRGFQLWVALPPNLELGPSLSIYKSAHEIGEAGPARVLLGEHEGVQGPFAAPASMNYLAVSLRAGQRWRYEPPANHSILWLATAKGSIRTLEAVQPGEIVVFEYGDRAVDIVASEDAEFVIGSAVPHPHDLVLGYYSVHTSEGALAAGETHIRQLREALVASGRF
ncbi:MAG TPA: pirin family protein [Ramlibacter sp.]|uniref:pirin family protein n=1 Tax=Ramlibacter sp. TaxID=1917967 RepID=UPI002BCB6D3A|nr:pirin family protein [Ramlibacter sp.]HVZ45750.1 pirin family protein [Ramlibacter sp.]